MEFDHFTSAQEPVYAQVLRELAAGDKRTHWMWFVFPQLKGLGTSAMSVRYALDSVDQAARYLGHDLLGARLRECTQLLLATNNKSAEDILGSIDCMKFQSCMTLFSLCSPAASMFHKALDKYYDGKRDPKTLELLGRSNNA